MPKRNSYEYQNRQNISQMFGEIDIAQYLFDNQEQEMIDHHVEIVKRESKVSKQVRSPLRSEENMPEGYLRHQSSSSCQEIAMISNQRIDEENNSDLLKNTKDKSIKNKLYAKNYRQKKKQRLTILEEENRFLKSKIDDLSFRLKEAQIQLNKLKHNHQSNTQNYQTARYNLLREIQEVIEKQESNTQKLLQVQNELRKINAFDSKHRMDLLNYFMSELLQNLLNDMNFYFVDNMVEKKGICRENESVPLRKIDLEVRQILGQQQWQKTKQMIYGIPPMVLNHFANFKNLWKNLYEDYLNIINQGTLIETLCKQFSQHDQQNIQQQVLNYLKLQLYFQKIKYRKDMRQLRQSWFHQQENQQKSNGFNGNKKLSKRIKLIQQL